MRFLLLILLLSLSSCISRQHTENQRPGKIISIDASTLYAGVSDTLRLGRMRSGEVAVQRLWIENKSAKPIVILNYATTCGCAALDFSNKPINSGEAQQLTVTFDSRGEWGWQFKRLDISLSGAEKPIQLFIEAEVE